MDGPSRRTLIGRSRELQRLADASARAAGGEARTVLVAGEAGIGKTRLVDAFAASVTSDGGRVLTGGCLALSSGGLPYAPFVEALRALVRDTDPGRLPALLGPNRDELARLMPEVRARSTGTAPDRAGDARIPAPPDERFAQVRLFELVLGVFERLARVTTVVLLIEDLQWADSSTRDLIAFLVRNLRDERVLIIATVRADELAADRSSSVFLAELERNERVDRIDLARFGRDDLALLLAEEPGPPPDADLIDRIWERSDGNPFFAEQVLAASRETDERAVPARLRDVVLARLSTVSDAGQEVLRVASAAGPRIDDTLLEAVAGLPPAVVRTALREVVDRRILVPAGGDEDPHHVFTHALLRELIHDELFPGERARLHAGFAAALEARLGDGDAGRSAPGPPPSPAELAYHWDAAGDDRRAFPATVDAARAAERSYAFVEAHRHYVRAIELQDRLSMTGHPAGDGVDLLVRAAETAVLIGEYRPAVAFGRRAIARVDPAADPDRAAALLERQRWYLWQAGDRAAAAEALAEAARLVPERPPSASRARILAHQAGVLMSEGRFADSIPIAEAALGDARAVDSVPDEALALGILGADLALLGRIDEGLDRVREALAIAERIGSTEGIALGATNLAVLLDRVGRTEDALDVAISGWQRTGEIGVERTYGGLLLAIAAKAALALGRWDEADDFLRRGLARDPVGAPGIRLRIQRGRLDTFRGDLEAATETLRTARAADDAVGGTEDRAAILAALAELAVAQDHTTNVRAAVAEGLRLAAAGSTEPALAGLAVAGLRAEADAAARARARRDDAGLVDARRRATAIAGQLERLAGIHPTSVRAEAGEGLPTRAGALAALCRAELRRLDDRDTASDWFGVAGAFDAIGRPYPAAQARVRAGSAIVRARGARAEAAAALSTARTTATRLGARPLVAEIDLLARQARLDVGPTTTDDGLAAPPDGSVRSTAALDLTPREAEVLGLIAAGWSNREIAEALFISRKTASVHASHIFDKLGAGNRVEAAAIAHRLGLGIGAPPPPGSVAADGRGLDREHDGP